MADQDDNQELSPTPEQIRGYAQRMRATFGHGYFDNFCAGLHTGQIFNHKQHHQCVVIPQLASELIFVEVGDAIGLAAPKKHSKWMDKWPYEAIVVTQKELIFVSKLYDWVGKPVLKTCVSTGVLPYTPMLNRFFNQSETYIYEVEDPRLIYSARLLCEGDPIKVYKSVDGIPVTDTREYYERAQRAAVNDSFSRIEKHFAS